MGTRTFALLAVALACTEPDDSCETNLPIFCPNSALAAASPSGQAWPSYSAASSALADCAQSEEYLIRRRGTCSDGKRFLGRDGGFTGDDYFFLGEAVVGFRYWTDVLAVVCGECTPSRGQGDTACDVIEQTESRCFLFPGGDAGAGAGAASP